MAFFIPSIQFFFGLPRALFCLTSTICHIYTFYLLMMDCWYARNM
jgi:hypothetical protein